MTEGVCSACKRVGPSDVVQVPTMYPMSDRYCSECMQNKAEPVWYLLKELQLDYKKASQLDVSGYIDGIYIPMKSLKEIYRCICLMCDHKV